MPNLTPEQEKEIRLLQASNEMLERTKEEARLRGKEESIDRISFAQDDLKARVGMIDEQEAVEMTKKKQGRPRKKQADVSAQEDIENVVTVEERLEKERKKKMKSVVDVQRNDTSTVIEDEVKVVRQSPKSTGFNDIDPQMQYDIVTLPSNGECYPNKMNRIPVGYLNAYDENVLTSPQLYKDGLVVDYLLKHKILNSQVDVESLCKGDADAIVLFLRATSYGNEFPITVKDPESGKRFDSVADLSQLKMKDFKLKGDEDGYFDFELPMSHDVVKFRFLTRKDEADLEMLNVAETKQMCGLVVENYVNEIEKYIVGDDNLDGVRKQTMVKNLNGLKDWCAEMSKDTEIRVPNTITNTLEMTIMAVNGNYDKKYIANYIKNMSIRDSNALRRYIAANEPGIDFTIDFERPESLGGGSFKTFLEWDDFVFYNIA